MKRHNIKRILAVVVACVGLFLLSIPTALAASPDNSLTDTNIGISGGDNGTWSASGTTITGSISGNNSSALTITNNYKSTAIFSFKYSGSLTSGYWGTATASIDAANISESKGYASITGFSQKGTIGGNNAFYNVELAAGGQFTIALTGNKNAGFGTTGSAASITLSEIALKTTGGTTLSFAPADITYTVDAKGSDGNALDTVAVGVDATSNVSVTAEGEYGFTITAATPHYHLAAILADGAYQSVTSSTINVESGKTVTPLFVYDANDTAPFSVDNIPYWTWENACRAAGATGTVILVDDYTFPTAGDSDVLSRNGLIGNGNYVSFTYANDAVSAVTYKMPTGVTFLMPYAAGATSIGTSTTTDELDSTYEYGNVTFTSNNYASISGVLEPESSVHRKLTAPENTTIEVNSGSKFVIGGTIVSGTSDTRGVVGATAGSHSNLYLGGTLNIKSGGILSVCGYILPHTDTDGTTHTGTVETANGGKVYQPFVIMDHRDGHYAVNCTGADDGTFVGIRYCMPNIQIDLSMTYGAWMYGYIVLYSQTQTIPDSIPLLGGTEIPARYNVACEAIIGTNSAECLLGLKSGTTLTALYDASDVLTKQSESSSNAEAYYNKVGKTTVTITGGGASLGYMELFISVVKGIVEETVYSYNTHFPIPYNYEYDFVSGTFDINYDLLLLPGATMKVGENAALTIGTYTDSGGNTVGAEVAVLDGLRDYSHYGNSVTKGTWYNFHYPSTNELKTAGFGGTANLIVDGTMTVKSGASFGGYVQTNGSGTLVMESGAGTSVVAATGHVGDYGGTWASLVNDQAGRTERTLNAWLWAKNGDLIKVSSGTTYCGVDGANHTVASYDYTLYTKSDGTSTTVTGEALNANTYGSWSQAVAKLKDTDGAYMKDTSGNEIFLPLVKAVDAYQNSSGVSHIEMVGDSTDATSISISACIDLNGHNVSNVTVAAATEFMDLTTNGYTAAGGQLTVIDGADNIAPVTPYTLADGLTKRYYVKAYDEATKTYTFPRVAAAVSKLQFALVPSGDSVLMLEGTFRGNAAAATALDNVGFSVNGTPDNWMPAGKTLPSADGGVFHYGVKLAKLSELSMPVQALLQYDGEKVPSADQLSTIKTALQGLPTDDLTESQKAALNAFKNN